MGLKLYKVTRSDPCDYDEYDAYVVAAQNKLQALDFEEAKRLRANWKGADITQIGKSTLLKPRIILASFNAG